MTCYLLRNNVGRGYMTYDVKKGFWTAEQQDATVEMHTKGRSVFEIAPIVHKTPRQVHDALALLGLVEPMPTHWPDAWDAELKAIYNEMTTQKAADHLSEKFHLPFTKNAIIGRMNRLGLRRTIIRKPKEEKPKAPKPPKRQKVVKVRKVVAPVEPIGGTGIPLSEMTFPITQCRWPTGRGVNGMLCCGQPTADKKSYCEYHNSIAVMDENTRSRPRKTDRMGGLRLQQLSVRP